MVVSFLTSQVSFKSFHKTFVVNICYLYKQEKVRTSMSFNFVRSFLATGNTMRAYILWLWYFGCINRGLTLIFLINFKCKGQYNLMTGLVN